MHFNTFENVHLKCTFGPPLAFHISKYTLENCAELLKCALY